MILEETNIMSWIVIENFIESIENHLKLLNELRKKDMFFLARKESLDFDELDNSEQAELIEDNYDLYKDGLLSLQADVKNRIENKIYEIGKEILNQSVRYSKTPILEILLEKQYISYSNELKYFITNELIKYRANNTLLSENKLICKIYSNQSYKYHSSEGLLENEAEFFKWYRLNSCIELEQYVEENSCNYNLMVSFYKECIDNYNYYINFFEGDTFTMAVKDNIGDFCDIFEHVFPKKYKITFRD